MEYEIRMGKNRRIYKYNWLIYFLYYLIAKLVGESTT